MLIVGALLPDLYSGFYSDLLRGLDTQARAKNTRLLVSSLPEGTDELTSALQRMEGRIHCLVIMAPTLPCARVERLTPPDVPLVLLAPNMRQDAPPPARASVATVDNYSAARGVVAHLVASGRQRIAHLGGPTLNADAQDRQRGYCDEVQQMIRSRVIPPVPLRLLPGDFSGACGVATGEALARETTGRPDAVFAANDEMALGLMRALKTAGVRVPEDVAVVGFDDVAVAEHVGLTTVRVQPSELGTWAINTLVDGSGSPVVQRFAPVLVVRASAPAGVVL